VASKQIRLEVNADKTKYMVMSRDQNAGYSHNMKIDNRSFELVEEFKYLGTNLTNQNYIQEEIKSRLKLGNACYHVVQNLLSSSLLSKDSKVKIYRIIILPVVVNGCETWPLTLKEERRTMFFENGAEENIWPKRDEVTGDWRKLYNEELNGMYSSPTVFQVIKSRRNSWAGHVVHMVERRGAYRFWCGNLKERDQLGDPGIDGRIILRCFFRKWDVGVGTGSSWLRVGAGGWHLRMWY